MSKILSWMLLAAMVAAVASGCGEEDALEGAETPLELGVYALDNFCSNAEPLPTIDSWRAKVVRRGTNEVEVYADTTFPGASGHLKLTGVPEGDNLELTLLALPAPDPADPEAPVQPILFGRADKITVSQDKPAKVEMLATRYADISCPEAAKNEVPNSAPNVLFSTTTKLADGKILIAGGFTKVMENAGDFEIGQATNQGWIFDPKTGVSIKAKNDMNTARGAHAAVFLPNKGLVLIVGGAERLYRSKQNNCFPWYFKKDKAGTVGYTYELFDVKTSRFLQWDTDEWPDQIDDLASPTGKTQTHTMIKQARRVFPTLSLNQDGTVVVSGGGLWPSCDLKGHAEADPDYRVAEIYRPKDDNRDGQFLDSHGALTMRAMRSGHAATLVKVQDKLAVHLLWGGSEDKPLAELYFESTGQLDGNFGAFREVKWVGQEFEKKIYFPTVVRLKDNHFLVTGGVESSGASLKVPSTGNSWLVKVQADDQLSVSKAEGLEVGRYFHSAATLDEQNVVIFGGFSSSVQGENTLFADMATPDLRFFNLSTGKITASPGSLDGTLLPRAGHAMIALSSGCMLIAGGVDQPHLALQFEGGTAPPLMLEIFCPSVVCPEGLWASGCYQM